MVLPYSLVELDQVISTASRWRIIAICLVTAAVIGVVDYLKGIEVSFSLFYLGPVGFAAWYAGRSAGALISVVSIFPTACARFVEGHFVSHPGLILWNVILQLGTMLIIAYLMEKLHHLLQIQETLATSDPLTGILNRRAFMKRLQYSLDLSGRNGSPITLVYIDLDNFKKINDSFGHDGGDRVLRRIAYALTHSIRRTDFAARLGGDEFALLLPGIGEAAARTVIAKIRHSLAQDFDSQISRVTCSIGCLILQEHLPKMTEAIKAADRLMYEVKANGKNSVVFARYIPEIN